MTALEKLKKIVQANRRLEAKCKALEQRGKYLIDIYKRAEAQHKVELASVCTKYELMKMILARVAIEVEDLVIPIREMEVVIARYHISYDAIAERHEICIHAKKKEQA